MEDPVFMCWRNSSRPPHRETKPFFEVSEGGRGDQTEFEETSLTQHTQVQKEPGTANVQYRR